MKKHYVILNMLYDIIRRMFWKDYDSNENFICACCGKPLYERLIFCSKKCSDKYLKEQMHGSE